MKTINLAVDVPDDFDVGINSLIDVVEYNFRILPQADAATPSSAEAVAWRGENILRRYPEGWAEYCTNTTPVAQAVSDASALAIRLLNAVDASEFGGITCLDIDGEGNWFDVRDCIVRLLAAHTIPVAQTGKCTEELILAIEAVLKCWYENEEGGEIAMTPNMDHLETVMRRLQQPPQAQKAEGEPFKGENYVVGLWSMRNYEAYMEDQRMQPAASAVPEGYVLVPIEPTDVMQEAGFDIFAIDHPAPFPDGSTARRAIWQAMIAAAPAQSEQG